jgi:hypothetical protein
MRFFGPMNLLHQILLVFKLYLYIFSVLISCISCLHIMINVYFIFFVQQGQTVVGGTVDNDSGPVFDKTPIGSVSAPGLFLSELECARALRAYLCSRFIELDRYIIFNSFDLAYF